MKVPLGLFLGNRQLAEGIRLVAPVEIKPHVRYPAGTYLIDPDAPKGVQQPLDKIIQVLDKLKERCVKAQSSKIFMDAMEPMDKETTLYFNPQHELVEQNIVFLNVAFDDRLAWPDGSLWKLLSTLYPRYYPTPDGKLEYLEVVKLLETKQVQFLNDISLPYNESFLVEYKTVLDRTKYIALREKLDRIGKPLKKTDVFDATSDGSFICSRDLYSYTKKLILRADAKVTEEVWDAPEVQELLKGNPQILYRLPESRQGHYLAHNDILVAGRIKDFFKSHFLKLLGETSIAAEAEKAVVELRPKFLFLGPVGQEKEINLKTVESCLKKGNDGGLNGSNLSIFAFVNNKTPSLENDLRAAGVTFIFSKEDVLGNFNAFCQRAKSSIELF